MSQVCLHVYFCQTLLTLVPLDKHHSKATCPEDGTLLKALVFGAGKLTINPAKPIYTVAFAFILYCSFTSHLTISYLC